MTELLMPVRLSDPVIQSLAARYTLHKLWEMPDEQAFLDEASPRIDVIVTAGSVLASGMTFAIDAAFMARFPALKLVANHGVGYDTIDAKWAAAHGIIVTNTPDVLTEETADTGFGLLLNTVRQFPAAERWLRGGQWAATGPFQLTATLRDKTLGILGLGRIGKAIARRGEAFGLKIAYCGRTKQDGVDYAYYASPRELAAACDILMVAAPGGADTKNLVDAQVLDALGPEGFLINIARGSLVDEPALLGALREGRIAGAGLDVFAREPHVPSEFLSLDNVVLLPHVGSGTHATRAAMAKLLVDNVDAYATGRKVLTPVAECLLVGSQAQ
ncbi:MAG: 2-hydroxyacid dehydrogenase [Hyphomicrobiales bacterium]|jgi:lactate dehydrogenase-like 2-hydroxyacid dehydrogenase|nr:2-hydroxyacid dehydrogenase [Hyphomicrobiales bacterium]